MWRDASANACVIARARKWSLHLDTFPNSVTVRATKIHIKMEEKSQAAERETKKDEAHEKDARNKRYAADERLHPPADRGSVCGNGACPALRRPVLTYIRFDTSTRWTVRVIFRDFPIAILRGTRTFHVLESIMTWIFGAISSPRAACTRQPIVIIVSLRCNLFYRQIPNQYNRELQPCAF